MNSKEFLLLSSSQTYFQFEIHLQLYGLVVSNMISLPWLRSKPLAAIQNDYDDEEFSSDCD